MRAPERRETPELPVCSERRPDLRPDRTPDPRPELEPGPAVDWDAELADLPGGLPEEREAALRSHAGGCPRCAALLREAEAGYAWLQLLHPEPPVPSALLGKILAQTAELAAPASGAAVPGALLLPPPSFGSHGRNGLLTAAMAFFSIALTLSVTGARPGSLQTAVHAPAALSRHFFDAKKQVVSYYDNLLLVREVEATVDELRRAVTGEGAGPSAGKAPAPAPRSTEREIV